MQKDSHHQDLMDWLAYENYELVGCTYVKVQCNYTYNDVLYKSSPGYETIQNRLMLSCQTRVEH